MVIAMPLLKKESYTIVVGCGQLGAQLACSLSDAGGGVLIIDSKQSAFRRLSPAFTGITLLGDATHLSVLDDAGIADAAAIIVVTGRDSTNVMVAQLARELYNVPRVIARLFDPELECVIRNLDIGTISPVLLSTKEIEAILFPIATDKTEDLQ